MKKTIWTFVMALGLSTQLLFAQHPPPGRHPQGRPPQGLMMNDFFPPDLVMRYQQKIGLNASQQKYISTEMQKAQASFTQLQWSLHKEMEKLNQITNQANVKEATAIAQLDKILNLERQIKKQQLILMIRIKNKLTPQQKNTLRKLRPKPRRHR